MGRFDLELQKFESRWEEGTIGEFESEVPLEVRNDINLLSDLACVDLQNRIQSVAETRVESYLQTFPELAADDLVLLELIRTEYFFRPDKESVNIETYCERFPHLKHEIRSMFQIDLEGSAPKPESFSSSPWTCSTCEKPVPQVLNGELNCSHCGAPIAIGRYKLMKRIGEGAFGFVYRSFDPRLKREVAIKVPRSRQFLTPEETERFLRESRNAAHLNHPGIVKVYDTGFQNGVPFLVSELVEGIPLSKWSDEKEVPFDVSAKLVKRIAEAIHHAHQAGVIHRDLKPANIMICQQSNELQPLVMDFGLARQHQTDTTVTLEGQMVGTPAFVSPEQAKGDLTQVGPKSDIYSLGVVLFQLVSGELPFRGNIQMLIQQVIHDDPPSPSRFRNRIPRDLETICLKAIHREPEGRYASALELSEDLNRWLEGMPIKARRVGAAGKLVRWIRRRPAVASLLLALILSVSAGFTGIMWQWREAEVARIDSESARLASEADLKDALESVDKVLGHLGSDTLADIPQAKQLRADVLKDALSFFQRFRQRNPDDPRVAMQVGKAHFQVARIQTALGQYDEADSAYRAAIREYSRIENRAPDRRKWMEALADSYSGYASFLLRQSKHEPAEVPAKKMYQIARETRAGFSSRSGNWRLSMRRPKRIWDARSWIQNWPNRNSIRRSIN